MRQSNVFIRKNEMRQSNVSIRKKEKRQSITVSHMENKQSIFSYMEKVLDSKMVYAMLPNVLVIQQEKYSTKFQCKCQASPTIVKPNRKSM